MYGMFNVDKEKVCEAEQVDPDDERWYWLWSKPINGFAYDEDSAKEMVQAENERRKRNGMMETYGPAKYKRRTVTYGPWEDVP